MKTRAVQPLHITLSFSLALWLYIYLTLAWRDLLIVVRCGSLRLRLMTVSGNEASHRLHSDRGTLGRERSNGSLGNRSRALLYCSTSSSLRTYTSHFFLLYHATLACSGGSLHRSVSLSVARGISSVTCLSSLSLSVVKERSLLLLLPLLLLSHSAPIPVMGKLLPRRFRVSCSSLRLQSHFDQIFVRRWLLKPLVRCCRAHPGAVSEGARLCRLRMRP